MRHSSRPESVAIYLRPAGCHVVIPLDELATFYGVTPERLREVSAGFPGDFCFGLETVDVDDAAAGSGAIGGVRVFTEHGALLAGCLLNTPTSLARAVQLTRSCVALRRQERGPHPLALAG